MPLVTSCIEFEAFNHVSTTISEYKHNSVIAHVPVLQHAKAHIADIIPSVEARHGSNFYNNLSKSTRGLTIADR